MVILLTGGTGKTSIRLAQLLQDAKIPFLLASRRATSAAPSGMPAVKFDWLDESTFENPFQYKFASDEKISAIYLIAPEVFNPAPPMIAFIDLAVKKHNVKRFVFMTGGTAELGEEFQGGMVWQHLVDSGVEYFILRATWFMERFSEQQRRVTIRDEGKLYTTCGDGKAPFVNTADIAAVAFYALTDEKLHGTDYRILGPELLTHDEVATIFSKELGREIVHIRLSETEMVQKYMDSGMPEQVAQFITNLELATAKGVESRSGDAVKELTGRPAQSLSSWVHENRSAWE